MKYLVGIREVHVRYISVDVDKEEDAIDEAKKLMGRTIECLKYSHDLDENLWTVEESDELSIFRGSKG